MSYNVVEFFFISLFFLNFVKEYLINYKPGGYCIYVFSYILLLKMVTYFFKMVTLFISTCLGFWKSKEYLKIRFFWLFNFLILKIYHTPYIPRKFSIMVLSTSEYKHVKRNFYILFSEN